MEITNFKKTKIKLLTNEQQKSYKKCQNFSYFFKKFEVRYAKDKKIPQSQGHCEYTVEYRGARHSIYNLKYRVPKEIPVNFHNGSNYNCHFIIKELTEEFEGQFTSLREKNEKDIAFSVSVEKGVTKTN